jgi:hypothetical protein
MSPARYRALAALAAGALGFARAAAAQETETRGGFSLRTSVKCQLLVSRAGDDPLLFADRDRAVSLWRVRLEPAWRAQAVTAAVAYEQRLSIFSAGGDAAGLGALPSAGAAPWRVRPLAWPVLRTTSLSWRQEIDRAYVALHLGGLELTAGRQAIGWGRSVLFGAVDLFSPFTPLEADREWRRGVDAVRADVMLTDRASLDLVAAFGSRLDDSTLAARLRGYAGKVDLELVGGRRGRDPFGGLATSAAVGDAELHGELALFRARESRTPSPSTRTVVKATVGGSRRFPVGEGLAVYAEYHYSGFGAKDVRDAATAFGDPAFGERYARGDSQILGRHAVALTASLEVSLELALTGLWLVSPVDGSGVVAPSATVTFGDKVSLLTTLYVAHGRAPRGGQLRSEYGAARLSAFVQVRIDL